MAAIECLSVAKLNHKLDVQRIGDNFCGEATPVPTAVPKWMHKAEE
jgi:hypothetical protein